MSIPIPARVRELEEAVRASAPALCAERALLVTEFFRRHADPPEPLVIQKARALAFVLRHKSARIHSRELLVGCFTAHRVGGGVFPELHGIPMLEDLFRFEDRSLNPLRITPGDRRRLLTEVLPYWATRFLAARAMPPLAAARFIRDQLSPTFHLINETGGISHFVPDYSALCARGTDGLRREAAERRASCAPGSEQESFLRAVEIVCDGLAAFADGYRVAAERAAREERDPARRAELARIAEICGRVPREPARTLHEALQSILFAQIALNLESLDNSVSPGRLDQVLWPFFSREREAGTLTDEGALELLGAFAVKLCEIVPVFSRRVTRFHGGMFNGQVVVVGGVDRDGRDATNDLTMLFLELMDGLRTRQPNYHARVHRGSPLPYRTRIARALAAGAVSPAVYNDERIVEVLRSRGVSIEDARDYANVGCVEPVPAGRSFYSTDAALFNLPLCLELALNQGRRFGSRRRIGAQTAPAATCRSIDDLFALYRAQVEHALGRLMRDLEAIERANARLHPTPLTSTLLEGCVATGADVTRGGARYDGSGIQGVGVAEVGDSFSAIHAIVFEERAASLAEIVRACRDDFVGHDALRARLDRAPRYGNDDPRADRHVARVMESFARFFVGRTSTRGGEYVAGFYSVTSHQAFGEIVGALPSGRRRGEPFASGISPGRGAERRGPTAALRSQASLPLEVARNGVNFNLQLAPWAVAGEKGAGLLRALLDGAFAAGAMQVQVNVLDPRVLIEARDHPGRHPGLLVRVSGYSAYFDDLSPAMKQEIIDRTLHEIGQSPPPADRRAECPAGP